MSSFPNTSTLAASALNAIRIPPAHPNPAISLNLTAIRPTGPAYVYVGSSASNGCITPPGDNPVYKIDSGTMMLMREWFQRTLQGYISRSTNPKKPTQDIAEVLYDSQVSERGPAPMMHRIASSLTAEIRKIAGKTAAESKQVTEPFVPVRWEWMITPIAVFV